MKRFIVLCLLVGCGPVVPPPPKVSLPEDYHYIPTLAAAGAFVDGTDIPSPTPTPVDPSQCENCDGIGWLGDRVTWRECPVCNEDGKRVPNPPSSDTPYQLLVEAGEQLADLRQQYADLVQSVQPDPQGSDESPPDHHQDVEEPTSIPWQPSMESAIAEARKTGAPIWIHITDLKTCPVCIRIETQVLTDPKVITSTKEFVCVKLDWKDPWARHLIRGSSKPVDAFGWVDAWNKFERFAPLPVTPQEYASYLQKQSDRMSQPAPTAL